MFAVSWEEYLPVGIIFISSAEVERNMCQCQCLTFIDGWMPCQASESFPLSREFHQTPYMHMPTHKRQSETEREQCTDASVPCTWPGDQHIPLHGGRQGPRRWLPPCTSQAPPWLKLMPPPCLHPTLRLARKSERRGREGARASSPWWSTPLKALVWFWWIDETLSANLVYQVIMT